MNVNKKGEMGLYVHIPFCVKKCAYCDFLSFPANEQAKQQYVDALIQEIRSYKNETEVEVPTVFIGGGTPSCLTEKQLHAIVDALYDSFSIRADAEVTMEMNPGTWVDYVKEDATADQPATSSCAKADAQEGAPETNACVQADAASIMPVFRKLPPQINRVSIGLQSAHDDELSMLGRIHNWQQFLYTYEQLRQQGINNINVDLMSAIPGQHLSTWEDTLEKVLALKPEHISAYSLIVEEGTPFGDHADQLDLPSEEEERLMYLRTGEILKSHGYDRYEISNYAKPGYVCRHNVSYWKRTPYLGLGLGAASLIQMEKDGELKEVRFSNTENMDEYLSKDDVLRTVRKNIEILTTKACMEETMFLGLRMMEGVDCQEFAHTFGRSIEEVYGPQLNKLIGQGLLQMSEQNVMQQNVQQHVSLTQAGIDVSNYVMAEFLFE